MNAELQSRFDRACEIKTEIEALEVELMQVFGIENMLMPKKRGGGRPKKVSEKPRGGGDTQEVEQSPTTDIKEPGQGLRHYGTRPCCGSRGPRHKKGCNGRSPEASLITKWVCIGCEEKFETAGDPSDPPHCQNCGELAVERNS